ncbi:hypothetical protein [Streptomyces sp. PR69]|uniref:hypothetical protein n=1 Tax=Streptomyces sp. PR69 TaxID=2984950 RepID=UPI002263BE21|nr:hypothetical protein [Streptomyces sp. PR69]
MQARRSSRTASASQRAWRSSYERLTEETRRREQELRGVISPACIDTPLDNLPRWVDAAHRGLLRWVVFHCRRS